MDKALEINKLKVVFRPPGKKGVEILKGVNLAVEKKESLGLVGESGSGKTLTARAAIGLLPPGMHWEKGAVSVLGADIMRMNSRKLREIRGSRVSMIFQEPSSYLNPVFTAGSQVLEAIKEDEKTGGRREKVFKMFREVGLNENVYCQYPHQLSGGMQQRVMIAMALVNNPALLIADEPTTALDVTTAWEVIELLKVMMKKYGLGMLFITHDISLAAAFSQRIAVMYAGRIVEQAPAGMVFDSPAHPYTEKLISCLPERYEAGKKIQVIEGQVPDFRRLPSGCAFHPRCPYKKDICALKEPGESVVSGVRTVRCFRHGNIVESG